MSYDISEILKLPVEERMRIIGDIHDSLEQEMAATPDWHIEELERREELARHAPETLIPWDEVRKRFEKL